MTKETSDKLFTKVASQDKAARLLSGAVAIRKRAKVNAVISDVLSKQASQTKEAGPVGELITGLGYNGIPYLNTANSAGGFVGMLSAPSTEKEEAEWDKKDLHNLIPGVGLYRANRRMKRQLKSDKGGTPHYWSQGFGGLTAALLAAAAGAAGGAGFGAGVGKLTGRGAGEGAGVGALAGASTGLGAATIASLVGAIKAAVDRRRTKDEQKAYANSPTTKEWFLPGVGTYNAYKTIGRVIGDSEERSAKKEDKKEEKA